jgi:hypothetical protein
VVKQAAEGFNDGLVGEGLFEFAGDAGEDQGVGLGGKFFREAGFSDAGFAFDEEKLVVGDPVAQVLKFIGAAYERKGVKG